MIQTDKSHVIAELLLYASQTVIIKINTTITMRLNKAYGSAVGLLSFFFAPALVSKNEPEGGMWKQVGEKIHLTQGK